MEILPIEISDIINDYVKQLIVAENYSKCIAEINDIKYVSIAVCQICRAIKLKTNIIENRHNDCNHKFFLSKQLYINKDNSYFFKYNPFLFYCSFCNKTDSFFRHLFHN